MELYRALENKKLYEMDQSFSEDADRKSTRLNSSHRCISYAVFCLKKKQKKNKKKKNKCT